jgi:hypothetical protein
MSAITGGSRLESRGNTVAAFKEFSMTKTNESRAIENYLYIFNTWHCLKSLNHHKNLYRQYVAQRKHKFLRQIVRYRHLGN